MNKNNIGTRMFHKGLIRVGDKTQARTDALKEGVALRQKLKGKRILETRA